MGDSDSMQIRPGVRGFLSGARAVFWGLRRIMSDRAARRLALLPVLLTSLFYTALLAVVVLYADDLLGLLWARPDGGVLRYVWYVLVPIIMLVLLLPLVLLFATVAEAIGGPFYDKLAVMVLSSHGLPARDPGLLEGTIPDVVRSLAFAVGALVLALFALIPGIGIVFGVTGALVAWLGLASASINPALMVSGMNLGARLRFPLERFATMAGLGAVVWASMFVPFVGLISIPSAVVGASELYARSKDATYTK